MNCEEGFLKAFPSVNCVHAYIHVCIQALRFLCLTVCFPVCACACVCV